jgi:hypothetical protein
MATENFESFTAKKLIRRKNFIIIISGVCFGLFLISLGLLVFLVYSGKTETISTLAPGLICPMFAIILFPGLKKINAELKRRQS